MEPPRAAIEVGCPSASSRSAPRTSTELSRTCPRRQLRSTERNVTMPGQMVGYPTAPVQPNRARNRSRMDQRPPTANSASRTSVAAIPVAMRRFTRPSDGKGNAPLPVLEAGRKTRRRPTLPLTYASSTIGSGGLNFRVRDGIGCGPSDVATGRDGSVTLDFQ